MDKSFYHIIVNPTAGGGRSVKIAKAVQERLEERGVDFKVHLTQHPLHATDIAGRIVDSGGKAIISVGGDGTLQEIANAIAHKDTALGIIPAGTGNDFMRMLDIPPEPLAALDVILKGKTVKTDLGVIDGSRYFLNSIGTGIDVDVVRWSRRFTRFMKGSMAYYLGILCAVIFYKPKKLSLIIDGKKLDRFITVCAAGNSKMFGGGICVAPHADIHDGLLDVCIVNRVSNIKIPFLLPKMVKGTHESLRVTEYIKCKSIEISSEALHDLQADGEIKYQTPAAVTVARDALNVFAPYSGSV